MSAGRARRLRVEADKLEAFCLLVRAASAAPDQAAFAEVSRAAAPARPPATTWRCGCILLHAGAVIAAHCHHGAGWRLGRGRRD